MQNGTNTYMWEGEYEWAYKRVSERAEYANWILAANECDFVVWTVFWTKLNYALMTMHCKNIYTNRIFEMMCMYIYYIEKRINESRKLKTWECVLLNHNHHIIFLTHDDDAGEHWTAEQKHICTLIYNMACVCV